MQVGAWELCRRGLAAECSRTGEAGSLAEEVVLLLSEESINRHTMKILQRNGLDVAELLLAACVLLADLFHHALFDDHYIIFRVWLRYAVHVDDFAPSEDPTSTVSLTGMDRVMQSMMLHTPHSIRWLQVRSPLPLVPSNPSTTPLESCGNCCIFHEHSPVGAPDRSGDISHLQRVAWYHPANHLPQRSTGRAASCST